jgi:hypothetical protein
MFVSVSVHVHLPVHVPVFGGEPKLVYGDEYVNGCGKGFGEHVLSTG